MAFWIYAETVIAMAVGFYFGLNTLRRVRKPSKHSGALLQWEETPIAWRLQDSAEAFFVVIHMSTILILTVLTVLSVTRDASLTASTSLLPLVLPAVGFAAFSAGIVSSFPLAEKFIRGPQILISAEGIIRGQWVAKWEFFSHFETDAAHRIIRTYSNRRPQLTCYTWQFNDLQMYQYALSLLGQYLPSYAPVRPLSWLQTRAGFIALTLFCTVPFLLAGFLVFALSLSWAWIYFPIAVFVVSILGGKLIAAAGPATS